MSRKEPQNYWLYGKHSCLAALENPRRKIHKVLVTKNVSHKLGDKLPANAEIVDDRHISKNLTKDSVHQGISIYTSPLNDGEVKTEALGNLVVLLDEITDPHNIGAILRSSSAFGATTVMTTFRNSPPESGVLAKSASGALEYVRYSRVRNLNKAIDDLKFEGFTIVGLAGEGNTELQDAFKADKIAIVMGAEGKGMRQGTRESCDILAKITMSERQDSLNVSNAAALALWEASKAK